MPQTLKDLSKLILSCILFSTYHFIPLRWCWVESCKASPTHLHRRSCPGVLGPCLERWIHWPLHFSPHPSCSLLPPGFTIWTCICFPAPAPADLFSHSSTLTKISHLFLDFLAQPASLVKLHRFRSSGRQQTLFSWFNQTNIFYRQVLGAKHNH